MRLPFDWNRSRATAFGATLALHVAAILWLLALRFDLPGQLAGDLEFLWPAMPATPPAEIPPPTVPADARPPVAAPASPAPITAAPLPVPPGTFPPDAEGWSNNAKDAARRLTAPSPYQPFGEFPKGPQERPSELYPPSIFDKPLPRVGQTVTTAEGETIIWVSDYCFVSIQSRSLTQKEVHAARNGVRTCILAQFGGHKEARGDLFDSIKRPPTPQEPGCNTEGIGLSCSR
jgi:hypothetical protein